MRKTITKIVLASAILFAACNKQLDTKPSTSISDKDALNTSSDVQAALVGAYADLGDYDFYGGDIFVESELLANTTEFNWTGTYQGLTQIYNKAIPVDNIFVRDTWLAGYAAINDANNVLSALNVVDEEQKDRVAGEAEFIRGSAYFDLVRMFARAYNDGDPSINPGVPVTLTPTKFITDSSRLSRSSVADVYSQVISDLSDAVAKLPESNGFYANKAAAAAMLARVYLQKLDYSNAANAANLAIETATNNGYELVRNYADEFPAPPSPAPVSNTSEDLFAMQVTTSSGANAFQDYFSPLGRGDIQINEEHLALYESGDTRLGLFYEDGGSIYTGKFDNLYGNVHIIRLAEMYLIRAEANFRLGTAVGATPVEDINVIRARAGIPLYTEGELTLDDILLERRRELAFEGFRLHDIKRLEGNVGLLPWNSPRLILPIPNREIIVNPNLVQNEGY